MLYNLIKSNPIYLHAIHWLCEGVPPPVSSRVLTIGTHWVKISIPERALTVGCSGWIALLQPALRSIG
uniref:Uncharacterized protein n=1 Tax=Picea glauca TaxID=3330 RepID=A0A117NGW3_PICGL|nr:hypothetical protein ABT39_MTgene5603 [Picea glauca]